MKKYASTSSKLALGSQFIAGKKEDNLYVIIEFRLPGQSEVPTLLHLEGGILLVYLLVKNFKFLLQETVANFL